MSSYPSYPSYPVTTTVVTEAQAQAQAQREQEERRTHETRKWLAIAAVTALAGVIIFRKQLRERWDTVWRSETEPEREARVRKEIQERADRLAEDEKQRLQLEREAAAMRQRQADEASEAERARRAKELEIKTDREKIARELAQIQLNEKGVRVQIWSPYGLKAIVAVPKTPDVKTDTTITRDAVWLMREIAPGSGTVSFMNAEQRYLGWNPERQRLHTQARLGSWETWTKTISEEDKNAFLLKTASMKGYLAIKKNGDLTATSSDDGAPERWEITSAE